MKVNFDDVVSKEGFVGLGCAIRDHEGRLCGVVAQLFQAKWFPFVAECAAVKFGLKVASELSFNSIILEGDCE